MTQSRSGPYVWVTWLSRLLVGDRSCEWAAWFKAHHRGYRRVPGAFDFTAWQMNHTALLNEVRDRLETAGAQVLVEDQNYFNLRGSSGAVLGGKPDIVALDESGAATIYDVKTGQPGASDNAQVLIYMYALPYIGRYKGMSFDGRLIYADGSEVRIPAEAVDDEFKGHLFALMRRVSGEEPARRVPSGLECGMCDLSSDDCPERVEEDPREAVEEGAEF